MKTSRFYTVVKNSLLFLFVFSLIFGLVSCAQKSPDKSKSPDWYVNCDRDSDDLLVYSCGRGATLQKAKMQALQNASYQLSQKDGGVKVTSKQVLRKSSIRTEDVQTTKERIQSSFKQEVNVEAEKRIKHFEVERKKLIGDNYYVRYKIDRRPLSRILAAKIERKLDGAVPPKSQWKGPSPLLNSRLVSNIENHLSSETTSSDLRRDFKVSLERSREKWMLNLGPEADPIRHVLENPDFATLLDWEDDSSGIKLGVCRVPCKNPEQDSEFKNVRLNDGDEIVFQVIADAQEGYFMLLNIYPDGRVSLLKPPTKITEKLNFVPPRKKRTEQDVFKTKALENELTNDIYVAVHTESKVNTTFIPYLVRGRGLVRGNKSYKLDSFLKFLQRPEVLNLESLIIQTIPKNY